MNHVDTTEDISRSAVFTIHYKLLIISILCNFN